MPTPSQIRSQRRFAARQLLIPAMAGLLLAASPVFAQSERATMVQDDGTSRRVLHFSIPDFDRLRQPAYLRTDLPVFNEILALSEPQQARTADALDAYLEAFRELGLKPLSMDEYAEAHPEGANGPRRRGGGGNEWINDVIGEEMEKVGLDAGIRDDLEMGISIGMSRDDGDPDSPPQIDVGVNISADNLDKATQEKLQKVADAASKRIQERMSKDMAEGNNAFGGPVGPGGDAARDHMAERGAEVASMRNRVREFQKEADKLRILFENNVKVLLSEPQIEEWPTLERALVRIRTLPKGRLDGERTDLLRILKEMDLGVADETAIAEHAAVFEMSLHDALVRRNAGVDDVDFKIDEALAEGDGQQAIREANRAVRLHVAVRDLNDAYVDVFAGALSDEAASEFRETVLKQSYPRAYEQSVGGRALMQALAADDLSDENRKAIEELRAGYEAQLQSINDGIRLAIRQDERDQLSREIERVVATIENDANIQRDRGNDDPIDRAIGRRRTLDRQTMSALYGMLPPEMVASLPEVPQRRAGDPVTVEATSSSGGR